MTKEENSKIYPLSHISLTLYSCFTEATKAYLFFLAGGNPVLPLCRPMSESSEPCVAFSQDGTPNDRTEPSPSAPEPKRKRLISEASVEESGRSFEYLPDGIEGIMDEFGDEESEDEDVYGLHRQAHMFMLAKEQYSQRLRDEPNTPRWLCRLGVLLIRRAQEIEAFSRTGSPTPSTVTVPVAAPPPGQTYNMAVPQQLLPYASSNYSTVGSLDVEASSNRTPSVAPSEISVQAPAEQRITDPLSDPLCLFSLGHSYLTKCLAVINEPDHRVEDRILLPEVEKYIQLAAPRLDDMH
eukprot:TRINITY_DN34614_c0_g1_i1.p1 TRINITY_DN34614_c0_g1~~TRINITY_DN34614_c0_g1_i1.p1  ORF type:complete len:296 (+),score=35.25 TRINITY_DN34614_c0_g1_i1:45-932(+)